MTDEVESLIKDGIRAYKAQQRADAFEAFSKATEIDAYNAQAWLWLSAVVDTEEDQRVCLENVLHIAPNNAAAQKGLKMLDANSKSAPPPAPQPPPPSVESPAPTPDPEPPSATIATSSASAFYSGPDISGDEYDDWAASLPIGNAANSGGVSPFTDASNFFDEDVDFDSAFNEPYHEDDPLDDVLTDDPFGAGQSTDDADDDDGIFDDMPSGSFQSGPFSAGDVDDLIPPSNKAGRASDRSATSPRSPISTSARGGGGALITDDLRAPSHNLDDADPGEYFRMIPQDIKATRLPGTGGGLPLLAVLGVLGLLIANIAVLVMLISRLAG